jgi:hypothetical protein
MIEFLIPLPNILAQFAITCNQAYYANLLYCIGYPPFMYRNWKRGDNLQLGYFSLLWVLSALGVVSYLMGWDLSGILMEMIE